MPQLTDKVTNPKREDRTVHRRIGQVGNQTYKNPITTRIVSHRSVENPHQAKREVSAEGERRVDSNGCGQQKMRRGRKCVPGVAQCYRQQASGWQALHPGGGEGRTAYEPRNKFLVTFLSLSMLFLFSRASTFKRKDLAIECWFQFPCADDHLPPSGQFLS